MTEVPEKQPKEQTSARLDKGLKDRLQSVANKLDRSFAYMLERAMEEYLEAHEGEAAEEPRPRRRR